jgi:glycerol-3-phosphate cytidylyltransferase
MRIYTGGTFDLFHPGHVNFLRKCSGFGEVIVSLNTDEFIFEYKGKTPVMSFEERREVLLACQYVLEVVPNLGGADSKQTIELVKPDVVAIGSDWARKNYYDQMGFDQDYLDEKGIGLLYLPYSRGISSTLLRGRMAQSSEI